MMKAKREFVVLPEDDVKPTLTEWLEKDIKMLKSLVYFDEKNKEQTKLLIIKDEILLLHIKAGEFSGL
jgi:hypothetical protein